MQEYTTLLLDLYFIVVLYYNLIYNTINFKNTPYIPIAEARCFTAYSVNEKIREKTVLSEEQLELLLKTLVDKGEYQRACIIALAAYSGARKSELPRFKVSFFSDEHIIYGSLYKTPEKIKTKGRGNGKLLNKFVLVNKFKPYLDMWLKHRRELGVNSEWLFVKRDQATMNWVQLNPNTLNTWAIGFSKILQVDFYFHCLRHFFTTYLSQQSLPDDVIQYINGWSTLDLVSVYKDSSQEDELAKYFDENGIKEVKKANFTDL